MSFKPAWAVYIYICVCVITNAVVLSLCVLVGDYAGFPGCGLLRLHSTYRHDLKIYASDEGRVQMTAAAFAKVIIIVIVFIGTMYSFKHINVNI